MERMFLDRLWLSRLRASRPRVILQPACGKCIQQLQLCRSVSDMWRLITPVSLSLSELKP